MPSPDPKPAAKPAKVRNLTNEGIRAHLEQLKRDALEGVSEFDVQEVHLPERDKSGAVVKDEQGFTKLVKKAVLKRDLEAAKWDAKIAEFDAA